MPNVSAIRSLFLSPRPTYRIPDVAALLAIAEEDVVGWIDAGELEGLDTPEGPVVPWAELVSFGMDFWSQDLVEKALGTDAIDLIPELVRLTDLEVRIPRLQVGRWNGWRRSTERRSARCSRASWRIWCRCMHRGLARTCPASRRRSRGLTRTWMARVDWCGGGSAAGRGQRDATC